ncbi:SPOR domain-containing protein [Amantichitinum ursilacus]|uniref:Cell division protein FtsN n=1 Tax=Amantichitinum ursilacus TaxID=857265 RepID=A0A0N0GN40_9NEIS|nr:SPOR domain-containing protein [Amantichitinum ursilacus]KPC52100.1 cell division protein FtsN [Amantichitinum ursilacus]
MSRDMKRSGTSRPAARSGGGGGGSLLTGLVLGALVGVAVAVGVAFYINRGTNPFMNKTSAPPPDAVTNAPVVAPNQPEVLRPDGQGRDVAQPLPQSGQPATSASDAQTPPKATASAGERFDFYKMLPAMSDKAEAKAAAANKAKDTGDATPPTTVEAPKGAYLQAGAFQNEQDADNLKAKLALLGIEARIQTVETQDKGIWHRVRVGPFTSVADMDKVRSELQANGVQSDKVKAQ